MGYVAPVREAGSYFNQILFERVIPRSEAPDIFGPPLEYLSRSLGNKLGIDDLFSPLLNRRFEDAIDAAVREHRSHSFITSAVKDRDERKALHEYFLNAGDTALLVVSFFNTDRNYRNRFYCSFGKLSYDKTRDFAPPDEITLLEILRDRFIEIAHYLREMKREIESDRYMIH